MLTSMFVLPLFQQKKPTNSLLYSLQNKLICKFWMCMLDQIRKLHLKICGLFFFYRKERVRKNVSEITFLSLSYLFRLVCNVFDNYYLNCWKLSLYFYQFTCKVICINKPLMLSQKSVRKEKKKKKTFWNLEFSATTTLILEIFVHGLFFWSFSVCHGWSFSVSHTCSGETSWYHSSQKPQMPLPTCR